MNRIENCGYVQASSTGFQGLSISLESNADLFTELARLMNMDDLHEIILYPLDFVRDTLEYYGLTRTKVYQAIENAKRAQIHASDLTGWFHTDNEVSDEHSGDVD